MAEQTEVGWPTCEEAGCIGIRLTPARMCLAHASEEEAAAALKLVGETGAIDARGVLLTPNLLERVLGAVTRSSNGILLIRSCRFDRATFSGDAEFRGVIFSGDAQFTEATFNSSAGFTETTFNGNAQFGRTNFAGEAHFNYVTFGSQARFTGATFTGDAGFRDATFTGYAVFDGVTFTHDATFAGATFTDNAAFGEATFGGRAGFDYVTFSIYAGFGGTTFTGGAMFGGATFGGRAVFNDTIFSAWAGFGGTTFNIEAAFGRATFNGHAGFAGAVFKRVAWFGEATFSSDVSFADVIFIGDTQFHGVRFEQARQFGPLLAHRGLVLDDAQFAQPVQIEISSTGVCCRRARFAGGVQFRLRWARVVLDDTEFAGPSTLMGIPHLSSRSLDQMEQYIARAWVRLLKDAISERPHLLSLQRANVAGLGLSNVSAADCRFIGAHNLDKLRLEFNVNFAAVPPPWELRARDWGGREVIAEERAWRAGRSGRRWVAPKWPDWLDDQHRSELDPGQIASLYRALRKGREDSKDEPGAAEFYYGEMEMRRRARPTDNLHGGSSAASRGRAERGILTAYWLVSGYGLRAWRAITWLILVTALLAFAFHLVGFGIPPRPVSYWTSLLYAFRATLSLTDNEVTLTAWGRLLQGLLRLSGPVLLGLALLALRGRVKR